MPTENQTTDAFERWFSDHIGLARRVLAAVPDTYTDKQLNDIGRRARIWVMHAYREWEIENAKAES